MLHTKVELYGEKTRLGTETEKSVPNTKVELYSEKTVLDIKVEFYSQNTPLFASRAFRKKDSARYKGNGL